jgi:hypothetical protein
MKEYLVYYECTESSYGWGKKGQTNKIRFKDYNTKLFEEVKPMNWKVTKVEVVNA